MVGAQGSRRGLVAGALALLSVMAVLAGCASQNKFTYVSDDPAKTVFKVPSSWAEVDPKPIDTFFLENTFGMTSLDSAFATQFYSVKWSAAYDAAVDHPDSQNFLQSTAQPMAYSLVTPVPEGYRDVVNLNGLRNVFLPVTKELREYIAANGGEAYNVEVLADEVLTPASLHGIRTIYTYLFPGLDNSITFDLTALMSQDDSMLHVLIIRCSARCYRARSVEFDDIATSFTVGSRV